MLGASRLRNRAASFVWALLAFALAVGITAPAHAATDRIHETGRFRIAYPPTATQNDVNGTMVLNPLSRHAFQLFELTSNETLVRIVHMDTFKTLGEVVVPFKPYTAGGRNIVGEFVTTIDRENDNLYFAFLMPPNDGIGWGGIAAINGTSRTMSIFMKDDAVDPTKPVTDRQSCDDITTSACQPQFAGLEPLGALWGLEFASSYLTGLAPKLLLLFQEANAPGMETNSSMVWLLQWDATTGRQDWMYRVQSCQQRTLPVNASSRWTLSFVQGSAGVMYIGCNATGATGQAVRLTLDSLNKPTFEEAFPGPTDVSDVLADPDDDRLLFKVSNEEGTSFWVFNGRASSYSGVVGVTLSPASVAAGVDPSTGRLYVVAPPTEKLGQKNPGGLFLSDIRRNPAPQGLQFPEFAQVGRYKILVDFNAPGDTRRIFFRPNTGPDVNSYLIWQDDVAITEDAPLTDLDRFTTDVEEKSGITATNFTATGHGYGLRYIFHGGLEGAPPTGPDAQGVRVGREIPRSLGSPCGTGDRTMVLASTQQAQFSNNIMSAAATPGAPDPGTGTDIGQPTERCYPQPKPLDADLWAPFQPMLGEYPRPLDKNSDGKDTGNGQGEGAEATKVGDEYEQDERNARSDVDESVGSDWPFGVAQCSDGKAETRGRARPFQRDLDGAQGAGVEPDESAGAAGPPYDAVRGHEAEHNGFRASVTCDAKDRQVLADAVMRLTEQDAPAFQQADVPGIGTIRVGEVSSNIKLFLDPARGLVARTEATVREISIGNKIYIDKAWTVGEAWANGRFGGAATSFQRRLCGVRFPENDVHIDALNADTEPIPLGIDAGAVAVNEADPLDPNTDNVSQTFDMQGCGDSPVALPQNIPVAQQPLIDAMNRVLGPRGRVRTPLPDGELRQGTPGGYLASIQKDRLEQVGARSVNNDDSTQVPALEIAIFNDDPTRGRGRQIYQLAGVDASVTYGIYLLNPSEFDGFEPPEEPELPLPPLPVEPPQVPTEPGTAPTPPPPGPLGPITMLFSGISFLLRNPKDMLLAAAVWGMLYAPVQMSLRRRALKAVA